MCASWLRLLPLFAVTVALVHRAEHAMAAEAVYPGATWAKKTPAEAGMDAGKLAAFSTFAGGRGCVVRGGRMVYTWGDAAKRGDVASAAKPVYSHLLFKALELGKIKSLDDKVRLLEPRLAHLNPHLQYKDSLITWRHLATQTSCYGVWEQPGAAFDYNDWQMALFWDLLFLKAYGASYATVDEKVLHPLLADPIGCEDKPTLMAFGTKNRAGRLAISPRDFARFGLLYLRKGRWNGKPLISARHAAMAVASPLPGSLPQSTGRAAQMLKDQRSIGATRIPDNQCDHLGSYSWLWWTNGVDRINNRHWSNAPHDTYGCFGHGGKRAMVVIPSRDLIVSWNDTTIQSRRRENEALRLLMESLRD